MFEFHSGGPRYFSPYGEWVILLDVDGGLEISHYVGDQTTDYGRTLLTEAEAAPLWTVVRALDLPHLESSTRMAVPDEGAYTFVLQEGEHNHVAHIWRGDALKDHRIAALVAAIRAAITRATGKQAVL